MQIFLEIVDFDVEFRDTWIWVQGFESLLTVMRNKNDVPHIGVDMRIRVSEIGRVLKGWKVSVLSQRWRLFRLKAHQTHSHLSAILVVVVVRSSTCIWNILQKLKGTVFCELVVRPNLISQDSCQQLKFWSISTNFFFYLKFHYSWNLFFHCFLVMILDFSFVCDNDFLFEFETELVSRIVESW